MWASNTPRLIGQVWRGMVGMFHHGNWWIIIFMIIFAALIYWIDKEFRR